MGDLCGEVKMQYDDVFGAYGLFILDVIMHTKTV